MSQRRMFSPDIVASDAFLDMPVSSQALYFHLGMNADDDGFVNPKRTMRMIGASEDDLKVLLAKRFLLPFASGVVVIKHWLIHNLIRKDRYKETQYLEEKGLLHIKNNGSYTERQPNDNQMAPQVRLGKVRLGKVRLGKVNLKGGCFTPPTLDEITNYCTERKNGINPQRFFDFYASKGWMVGKNKMKDWQACVRTWEQRQDEGKPKEISERRVL